VPQPSALSVEMADEILKRYKLPGIDQMPAELIQARGRKMLWRSINFLILFCNKEELLQQWKDSNIAPSYKKNDKTDRSNFRGI
jgi:hypothetical protein